MTIWVTTRNEHYLIDDPSELVIRLGKEDSMVFDATNNEGVQIYKYTKEEEKK